MLLNYKYKKGDIICLRYHNKEHEIGIIIERCGTIISMKDDASIPSYRILIGNNIIYVNESEIL